MKTHSFIEPLEARIAPATLLNPTTVTYQDSDGDNVTVKISKPLFVSVNINAVFHWDVGATNGTHASPENGTPQQLQTLDFTALGMPSDATGVSITVTAKKDPLHGGNGSANVGFIKADGIDLGTVTVHGDLGHLIAGSGSATKPGVVSLAVDSMGLFGPSTQDPANASFQTTVTGKLGSLKVKGDVQEDSVSASGPIGSVFIGGSLSGGSGDGTGKISSDSSMGNVTVRGSVVGLGYNSGSISSFSSMGTVKIGGDLKGGAGFASGEIDNGGKLSAVTIGGSLIGSSGGYSGSIQCGDVGSIKISGNVQGGSRGGSGLIATGKLASITIGGSLLGGSAPSSGIPYGSGEIVGGDMGPVKITGDIQGGGGTNSGIVWSPNGGIASAAVGGSLKGGNGIGSGQIVCAKALGPVSVHGDVTGGMANYSGQIAGGTIASVSIGGELTDGTSTGSGSVQAAGDIGPVRIGKSVTGGGATAIIAAGGKLGKVSIGGALTSADAAKPVTITALGKMGATKAADAVAIAGVSVKGYVFTARILAGYDRSLAALNPDAGIGPISVGDTWQASSIAAGVADSTANGFGHNDTLITGDTTSTIFATIASITIKGTATGTAAAGDFFGLTAQKIGKVSIHGAVIVPTGTDTLLDSTHNDFRLVTL